MTDAEKMTALITAATNARNVLLMNLDLFEGEESSDHRDSEEEATSVGNALSDALKPFELPCPLSVLVEEETPLSTEVAKPDSSERCSRCGGPTKLPHPPVLEAEKIEEVTP